MPRYLSIALTACLAVAAIAACGESVQPDPGNPINLEEGRGTLLSGPDEQVTGSAVVWSLDGEWLYYAAVPPGGGDLQLRRAASDASGSEMLDLGDADLFDWESRSLETVAPAPSGDVYVVAGGGVLRLSPGADPALLPGLAEPWGIALAPGGERLVYATTAGIGGAVQDLWSYDLGSGSSTQLPAGWPLVLSPDGSELLYTLGDYTYHIASLATGATRPVELGIEMEYPEAVRWLPGGIRVLFQHHDAERNGYDYYVRDVSAGTTSRFYQESFDDQGSEVRGWSPDGSRMALWLQACLSGAGLLSCDSFHSALYVVDVAGGTETWIAGARNHQVTLPRFAPDNQRVVYVIEGQLFLSVLP